MCPDRSQPSTVVGLPCASGARTRAGFSLIEMVVAIAVISIALSGTLLVVDSTTRRSAHPMLERQAIAIASAYLEEVLQKNYVDPDDGTLCPAPEASRALFDNLCDYNGWTETGARDQEGNAITGLENYQISISIDTAAGLGGLSGSTEVLRIDMTVRDPLGNAVRLSSYRTNT